MCKSRKGFSLVTTMFLMGVISTLMTMLVFSGGQRTFTARRLINRIKATAYAEAGFEHALAKLMENWEYRFNAAAAIPANTAMQSSSINQGGGGSTAEAAYGDGTFALTLTPISNRFCLVQSTGFCGNQDVSVEVLVEDFLADFANTPPTGERPDNSAWEETVFSAGTLDVGGSGDIRGSLHANSALKINGNVDIGPGSPDISSSTAIGVNGSVNTDGSYFAPSIEVNGGKNSGATYIESEVPKKAFPELDLTALYKTAIANGQVINGNVRSNNDISWNNVPGGVIWINGNMRINANAYLGCTVIATGFISITGNANWGIGNNGYNHIVSRDSTIKIAGNADINGVLYAPGDISLSGTVRLNGSVVSGSDVDINGNVEVMHYDAGAIADLVPPEDAPRETLVGIAAWQK